MAHVMLIDDDADLNEANRMVLEAAGHTVSSASSGQAGWDMLQTTVPDVIVLDVMMEDFWAGFSLAHDLDIRFPQVPVILLTAVRDFMSDQWQFSRENDRDWLPIAKFLEKPVSPAELVEAISEVLSTSSSTKTPSS